jgi:hypothetical protein
MLCALCVFLFGPQIPGVLALTVAYWPLRWRVRHPRTPPPAGRHRLLLRPLLLPQRRRHASATWLRNWSASTSCLTTHRCRCRTAARTCVHARLPYMRMRAVALARV